MITHDVLIKILDYEPLTGVFRWKIRPNSLRAPGDVAGCSSNGRHIITWKRRIYYASVLAWFYTHKRWPKNTVDHKDRNKWNDALLNLREATRFQQNGNMPKRRGTRSGFRGVYLIINGKNLTRPWTARVQKAGEVTCLGYFHSPLEAAIVRDKKARELFGEYYAGDPDLMRLLGEGYPDQNQQLQAQKCVVKS